MVLRQLDGEVSAQRIGVVQVFEVVLVQQVLPAAQGIQMLTPGGNGGAVSLNADGAENGIPQLSMARSSGSSGNTVAAQEGMGTEAMHQGKPLLIWSRSKVLRSTEPDF